MSSARPQQDKNRVLRTADQLHSGPERMARLGGKREGWPDPTEQQATGEGLFVQPGFNGFAKLPRQLAIRCGPHSPH